MPVLAVVCGMSSEAALIGQRPGVLTVVGAGDATALASKLELAIAAGADRVVSIGVAGSLSPQLQVGELVVGVSTCDGDKFTMSPDNLTSSAPLVDNGAIIHSDDAWARRIYRALTDGPKAVTFPVSFGNVVSTIAPVATEAARTALRASTAADVVDQESFIAATAAQAHGLPFVALRVVLDRSDLDLPPAALLPFTPSGGNDIEAILGSVASNPFQIAALLKLAAWSEKAMGNLAVALSSLGRDFSANG